MSLKSMSMSLKKKNSPRKGLKRKKTNNTLFEQLLSETKKESVFEELYGYLTHEDFKDLYRYDDDIFKIDLEGKKHTFKVLHRFSQTTYTVKVGELDVLDEKQVAAYLKEIRVLRNANHANIIGFEEVFHQDGRVLMVLEYCELGNLHEIYSEKLKPFNEGEVLSIMFQVLKGLDYLHKQCIAHRDIRSENICVNRKGEVKISGFDSCASLLTFDGRKQKRISIVGSVYWNAPEIIQNITGLMQYDEKVDIWSLGITAIECAQCDPPLASIETPTAMQIILAAPPPNFGESIKDKRMNDLLAKILVKDPANRLSAEEILQDLIFKNVDLDSLDDVIDRYNVWDSWSFDEDCSEESSIESFSEETETDIRIREGLKPIILSPSNNPNESKEYTPRSRSGRKKGGLAKKHMEDWTQNFKVFSKYHKQLKRNIRDLNDKLDDTIKLAEKEFSLEYQELLISCQDEEDELIFKYNEISADKKLIKLEKIEKLDVTFAQILNQKDGSDRERLLSRFSIEKKKIENAYLKEIEETSLQMSSELFLLSKEHIEKISEAKINHVVSINHWENIIFDEFYALCMDNYSAKKIFLNGYMKRLNKASGDKRKKRSKSPQTKRKSVPDKLKTHDTEKSKSGRHSFSEDSADIILKPFRREKIVLQNTLTDMGTKVKENQDLNIVRETIKRDRHLIALKYKNELDKVNIEFTSELHQLLNVTPPDQLDEAISSLTLKYLASEKIEKLSKKAKEHFRNLDQ